MSPLRQSASNSSGVRSLAAALRHDEERAVEEKQINLGGLHEFANIPSTRYTCFRRRPTLA